MEHVVTNVGNDYDEYHDSDGRNEPKISDILKLAAVFGSLAFFGYILNKNFFSNNNSNINMGEGRILNNHIRARQYFHKLEQNKYQDVAEKSPYFQRFYRTHNIAYPDVLYENLPYKQQPPVTFINVPQPPSGVDRTELTYAEPSNIITDNIMYEDGVPDIREDLRITGELPLSRTIGGRGAGGNTIYTTEYAPGLSEKVRKDNPVVVTETVGPNMKKAKRINRLRSPDKPFRKRFNTDFDEFGRPLQKAKPIYDTMDYLEDLKLTNEDFNEGEVGSIFPEDSLKIWEDFIVKGKLREGWEVLPSED